MNQTLIEQDLEHIWHPASYMKEFEHFPPLIIKSAKGSYIETDKGLVIDAISSWWCKSLGHGHPAVISAIKDQLQRFEHVISANTTHQSIVELGILLAEISGNQHVFFASDGSSAVEIAMKLALHSMQIKGHSERNQFIALSNAYHGETLATLSVSDLGKYKKPYTQLCLTCNFLNNIPYVTGMNDPLWSNCESIWPDIEQQLDIIKDKAAAIIVEPIIQGAGGMLFYSADFLKRLIDYAKKHDIFFIADEIMTGLGRTGEWLATNHAAIKPDLICLSKGLTSGSMPLSCVLIKQEIYELFYYDRNQGPTFLHSHTYSGNPLAVCAALATLKTMREININQKARNLSILMHKHLSYIAEKTGRLINVRSIGAIAAAEIIIEDDPYIGMKIANEALKLGALIRPLGNTLYWLPPINIDDETIELLASITLKAFMKG